MTLMTIDEFYAKSSNQTGSYRVKGFGVRSDLVAGVLTNKTEEKIGTVADVLLDEDGRIQYVIVALGTTAGRQVLLPADRVRIDYDQQCVYAGGMTKEQAEFLPEFDPNLRTRR